MENIFQTKKMNIALDEHHQKISALEQELRQLKQQDKKGDKMETLVSLLVQKLKMKEDLVMRLPIHTIDNIKVDVFLKSFQYHKNRIILFIEDVIPELHCMHDDCVGYHEYMRKHFEIKSIDSTNVSLVVEDICKILNELEFSKLHGTFQEREKNDDTVLIWKSLLSTDNIQWSVNECVVCMEETFSKTICGHHLCRCCFQKLKQCKCPVCRQSLTLDADSDQEETDEE